MVRVRPSRQFERNDMKQLDETGFVFIDDKDDPYHVRMWNDVAWLFRWHPDNQWVSLRPITQGEIWEIGDRKLSPEEAELYF